MSGGAAARLSRVAVIRYAGGAYVSLFRGTPCLIQLFVLYFGGPQIGIELDPFAAGVIGLGINIGAYMTESIRGAILAVDRGQTEAARSTGLSAPQTMAYVVLPQAVRNVLPDLVSNTVEVVKLTSLASVVSLSEMVYQADMARSVTYNASPIVLAAGVYLVLLWPVVRLISRHGRKIAS